MVSWAFDWKGAPPGLPGLSRRQVWFVLAVCLVCGGCNAETPPSVHIGSGPSFELSGNGRLSSFTVFGPRAGHHLAIPNPSFASVVWEIVAPRGRFDGLRVDGFRLAFGDLPFGYDQVVPRESQARPSLPSGAVYSFSATTTASAPLRGYFYVSAGSPVLIRMPDLCVRPKDGEQQVVVCGTNQPFQEPADLDGFVRSHTIEP